MICNLCPRRCNANRTENENINGFCKMPLSPKLARAALHFWEEPCISGTNGSGTVFFSGCSLDCAYCQNYDVSHGGKGKQISCERLAEIFKELVEKGAHNINLVTPTHYVWAIKKALDIYKPPVPVVYNSSGYDEVKTLKLLEGYVDIFLMDLKYLNPQSAKLFSNAEDYPEIAKKAILEAVRQQPKNVFKGEIMQKGVIVRHLLLPAATKEAKAVFDWVKENLSGVNFSIMSQYVPMGRACNIKPINRRVTAREYEKVLSYIFESDFDKVYIQERESANKKYTPEFDFEGV